jgi:hypothetical protein
MPSPRPQSTADLALAPVLVSIERNLAQVRDSDDLSCALALALSDDSGWYRTPAQRADRVQQLATRTVDLPGWHVAPTPDLQGLAISRGHQRVCVMFGKRLADYVTGGAAGDGLTSPVPTAAR